MFFWNNSMAQTKYGHSSKGDFINTAKVFIELFFSIKEISLFRSTLLPYFHLEINMDETFLFHNINHM